MFSKTDIEKYFIAEKNFGATFMIIGGAAILIAVLLFFIGKTNAFKGAALVIIVMGAIQLAASYTVYKRSDSDRKRLTYAYDMNPPLLKTTELQRMEKVQKNFMIIKTAEIVLLLAGIGLFLYFKNEAAKTFWVGFGLALAIEAALMFGADVFAGSNANKYLKGLREFAAVR